MVTTALAVPRTVVSTKRFPTATLFHVRFSRLLVLCLILGVLSWMVNREAGAIFNWYLTLIWSLYVPIMSVGLIGATEGPEKSVSRYSEMITTKVIVVIPTVARLDVLPALSRVIDSVLTLAPRNWLNYRIDVVVEEGAEGISTLAARYPRPEIRLVVVPKAYRTPKGSKFKGRANHYALERRNLEGESIRNVFIYHLDDDTSVGADTIASVAEFIATRQPLLAGQGVLTFPFSFSRSWFSRLADSVRPMDDLTRLSFFNHLRGTPQSGVHGEHLLVRADAEAVIGWDFGHNAKIEDAYFGIRFGQRFPGRFGFLNSCSYGASPASVVDLVRQRRRWANGLLNMIFDRSFPFSAKWPLFYTVLMWATAFFQNVIPIMIFGLLWGGGNTFPALRGMAFVWAFCFAYNLWLYAEGLRINLTVSGKGRWFPLLVGLILPGIYLFTIVEGWSATLGLFDFLRRTDEFVVIRKLL